MTSTIINPLRKHAKDLALIINGGLHNSRDDYDKSFKEADIWLNDVRTRNSRLTNDKISCEICGHCKGLEAHHIAGRKHDDRTIIVCGECHRILSDSQKVWGNSWEKGDQPERLRTAFFLLGLRDILRLKSKKTCNSIYESMADKLTEDISLLLKGD
jgi:hypothetical protein